MLQKKLMPMVAVLVLGVWVLWVHAEEFTIKDYTFTWHIAEIGGTTMEIQKTPEVLVVVFGRLGMPLSSLTVSPVQANAVGEMLKKTDDYYETQKKSDDPTSSDTLSAHNCTVNFTSKQGRNFEVRVKESGLFGSVVLMEKAEAVGMGKYLRQAEQMASFADKRVRP